MKILARVQDDALRRSLAEAAQRLSAQVIDAPDVAPPGGNGMHGVDVVLVEIASPEDLAGLRQAPARNGAALIVACRDAAFCHSATLAEADDWILLPTEPEELELRLVAAQQRAETQSAAGQEGTAELLRYEKLLYDKLTGLPTLPVMIERARELINRRGELTLLYIHFVWYSKVEEIYGWQKLDDVLETTAAALRDFYAREHAAGENLIMVSHTGDDDFILLTQVPLPPGLAEQRLRELSEQLGSLLRARIEDAHGEDIAALCGIYVGTASVFRNPKIRTERLIYRALREAAQAARSAEQWERVRKVADLKATLREGAVFMEYHPIIVTRTEEIYGYEALARGVRRELRSPEVLFEVAAEAKMIWELSRLLRKRAVQGIQHELGPDQYLFLNIDPHDFDDPEFLNLKPEDLGIDDPGRIVLEITERTAIKDYPRLQGHLAAFRALGFRFAVDDAGSGYAGLGSIANLNPDYIKLDITLISSIDSNFLKQNLVETLVHFAETQGAKVIAEGVERREEFETIRELGVHLTQGFLFHKPKYAKF